MRYLANIIGIRDGLYGDEKYDFIKEFDTKEEIIDYIKENKYNTLLCVYEFEKKYNPKFILSLEEDSNL